MFQCRTQQLTFLMTFKSVANQRTTTTLRQYSRILRTYQKNRMANKNRTELVHLYFTTSFSHIPNDKLEYNTKIWKTHRQILKKRNTIRYATNPSNCFRYLHLFSNIP